MFPVTVRNVFHFPWSPQEICYTFLGQYEQRVTLFLVTATSLLTVPLSLLAICYIFPGHYIRFVAVPWSLQEMRYTSLGKLLCSSGNSRIVLMCCPFPRHYKKCWSIERLHYQLDTRTQSEISEDNLPEAGPLKFQVNSVVSERLVALRTTGSKREYFTYREEIHQFWKPHELGEMCQV